MKFKYRLNNTVFYLIILSVLIFILLLAPLASSAVIEINGSSNWGNTTNDNMTIDGGDQRIKTGLFRNNGNVSSFDTANSSGTWSSSEGFINITVPVIAGFSYLPIYQNFSNIFMVYDMKLLPGGFGSIFPFGRYSSTDNTYVFAVYLYSPANTMRIRYRLAGTSYTIAESTSTVDSNIWYNNSWIKMYGNNLSFFYNGVTITATDSTFSDGKMVLASYDSPGSFDNIGILLVDNDGNIKTFGNTTHYYLDAGTGNVIGGYNISVTTPANTNYSLNYRDNVTKAETIQFSNQTASNGWINGTITGTKYQIADFILTAYGNTTSTPEEIKFQAQTETASSPPSTYTPPTPTNIANTTGRYWINHTVSPGTGNITDSYNISSDNFASWNNGSANYLNVTVCNGCWKNVSFYAYNNSGVLNQTPVSMNTRISFTFVPPAPLWVSNMTGSNWVNHTWQAGAGNVSDSYNVTFGNGTWINITPPFVNESLPNGGHSNVTIWAWNNSQGGTRSLTNISNNSYVQPPTPSPQIPNITSWSNNKTNDQSLTLTINTSEGISFNFTSNQTLTGINWAVNTSNQSVNSNYFNTSWATTGVRNVSVNGTNANGSSNTIFWNVTVQALPTQTYMPPNVTSLAAICGNFYCNTTWQLGTGNLTNSYNVSVNGMWINDSLINWVNSSSSNRGWNNVSVGAYNNSGLVNFTNGYLNNSIPTQPPTIAFDDGTPANNSVNTTGFLNLSVNASSSDNFNISVTNDFNRDLIVWWTFNNDSGTIIEDKSSYKNNGTFNGTSASLTKNILGNQLLFNGINNSINIPNFNISGSNYTIMGYITIFDNSNTKTIISSTINSNNRMQMEVTSIIKTTNYNGNYYGNLSSSTLNINETYHFAYVNNSKNFRLYLNTVNQTGTTRAAPQSAGGFFIGKRTSNDLFFNGSIEDVKIYNRALSWNEINASYNASANKYLNNFTGLANGNYNSTAYVQDSTGNITSVTRYWTVQIPQTYIPPASLWVSNTTGTDYANHTWTAGAGNVTDSFNVTLGNGTWINTTALFINESLPVGGWSNVTVWSWNNSNGGTRSLTNISNNSYVQPPITPDTNTTPSLSSVQNNTVTDTSGNVSAIVNQTNAYVQVRWSQVDPNLATYQNSTNSTSGDYRPVNITGLANGTLTYYSFWAWNSTNTSKFMNSSIQSFTTNSNYTVPSVAKIYYNVSGRINDVNGTTISNANIIFGSNSTASNASGGYNFLNVTNGTYNFITSKTRYSTNISSITVNGSDLDNLNFTISLNTSTPSLSSIINGSVGDTWAILNATSNQSTAITQIRLSNDSNFGTYQLNTSNLTSGEIRSINVTGLNNGTLYYYIWVAWNSTNTSKWYNTSVQNFTTNSNVTIPPTFMPPSPVNLTNTTYQHGANFSWEAGTGNITNSYNLSINNTWTNGSTLAWINKTGTPGGWINISVYAFNSSGTGTLNQTPAMMNVSLPGYPPLPNITSWSNSNTTNSTLSFTILRNTNITFNITANQSVTTSWTGGTVTPTKINGTGENISFAYYNFTTAGTFTVIPSCTNANGSCTNTPTWTVTVSPIGGFTVSGYVSNTIGLTLQNARIDFNGNHAYTDANGYYVFSNVNEATYTALARAIGYTNSSRSTTVISNTVLNFTLNEPIYALQEDTINAGLMGIVGGLFGAMIAISVLKRRKKI